jgi:hypothetical protein
MSWFDAVNPLFKESFKEWIKEQCTTARQEGVNEGLEMAALSEDRWSAASAERIRALKTLPPGASDDRRCESK